MKSALCYSLILLLGITPAVALAQRGPDDEKENQERNNSQGSRGQTDNTPTQGQQRGQQNSTPNRGQQNNTPNRGQQNNTPNRGQQTPNRGQGNQNQLNRGNVQVQPNNQGRNGNTGNNRGNNRGNNQNNNQTNQNNPSRGQSAGSVAPSPGVVQPDTVIRGQGTGSAPNNNQTQGGRQGQAPGTGVRGTGGSATGGSGATGGGATGGGATGGAAGTGTSGAGTGGSGASGTGAGGTGTNAAPWDGAAWFPDSGKGGAGTGGSATGGSGATGSGATGSGATGSGATGSGAGRSGTGGSGAGGAGAGGTGTGGTGTGGAGANPAPWDGEAFFPDSGKGGAGTGASGAGGTGAGGTGAGGSGGVGQGSTPQSTNRQNVNQNNNRGSNRGNSRGSNQNNNQNNQNNPSRGQNLGPVDRTPGLIQPDTLNLGPGAGGSGIGGTGAGAGGRGSLGDRGTGGVGIPPGGRGAGNARGDGRGRGNDVFANRGNNRGGNSNNNWNNNNWGRGGNWNSDYDWRRNNTTVNNFVNVTPRYYYGHGNWHRGDWNSFWGPSWGYQPYIYTGWGIGSSYFSFGYTALAAPWTWGYYSYSNPYWVAPVNVVPYVNYSQPIIVAAAPVQQPVLPAGQQTAGEQAAVLFDKARAEFLKGNYQQALNAANEAVALTPNDAVLHEFRALCLFALKDYQQAAAGLYAILSIGPGWDWETMAGLYGDVATYTVQMKALEDYRREHPEAAEARFVLGYHYLVLGHKPEAAVEFEKVVALQPNDQLSKQLLQGIARGDVQPTPPPEPTSAQALPANGLVGNWSAQNPDGSKFGLAINGNNEFQWTVSRDGQQQKMAGTYKLENNYLILKATEENSLVGQVTMDGDNRFVFKLAGNNPSDPGLTFTK